MKRIAYFVVAALVAAASCSKEVNPVMDNDQPVVEDNQPVSTVQKISFTAYADNGDETRTSLNEDNSVTWAAGEAIYVFDGKAPRKFVSTNTEPAKVVTFEGEAAVATTYYAVSPAATMSGNTITATIPVFQTATAGTFDPKAAISVAVSGADPNDPTALKFKNAAAAVKFRIQNSDVTKIRLDAIGGEPLAGKATIVWDDVKSIPRLQMSQDEDETESCVILQPASGTFATGMDYVIAIAPGTYSGGFRLTLIKADGKYASFANTNSQTLERSDLMNFGTMPAVTTWKEGTLTTLFTETFDGTDGTGGHDGRYTGSVGTSTIVYDNQYFWGTPVHFGGAKQCVKFGTSSEAGSLYVSNLSLTGPAVLSFSAAGWGDTAVNTLEVEVVGATASGDTDITLSNGEWTSYSVNISDVTGPVSITFWGMRGFLDDIKLEDNQAGGPVDPDYDAPSLEIQNVTPQNRTVGPNNGRASFDVEANVPWTISASQSFATLSVADNHVDISFSNMTEGTTRDVTVTVTTSEGISQDITFTQVIQTTQYSVSYSALLNDFNNKSSGSFYTKNSTNTVSNLWNFERSTVANTSSPATGYVQLGKNGGAETVTFATSAIPGTIKSIDIFCAAYQGKHQIQIKVGDTVVQTQNAPTWSNNTGGSVKWTGEATGDITITAIAQSGARAFYLKTITVEYEQ